MSGLTEADRPVVLGWVADALDGVAVPQAISALLRKAAATEDEPLVPEVGKLYEFDTLDVGEEPAGTHVGWWDGPHLRWIGCFGRGAWSPEWVTGFRPYNPAAAEPVPVGPKKPAIGDRVTTVLTGELIDYDADAGVWQLRGSASGGHVDWTWDLHWATEFEPAKADGAVQ